MARRGKSLGAARPAVARAAHRTASPFGWAGRLPRRRIRMGGTFAETAKEFDGEALATLVEVMPPNALDGDPCGEPDENENHTESPSLNLLLTGIGGSRTQDRRAQRPWGTPSVLSTCGSRSPVGGLKSKAPGGRLQRPGLNAPLGRLLDCKAEFSTARLAVLRAMSTTVHHRTGCCTLNRPP
jgi:hypothetical protein